LIFGKQKSSIYASASVGRSCKPIQATRISIPIWPGCRHPELPTRSRDLPVGSMVGVFFSVGCVTLISVLGDHYYAYSSHRN